ncbi:MAG: helix-turn-helix transcriptional regulator [Firmicutes bacterium]|nr:helix-turn-helix transcriptional regulator [Bacillota bacterium]
MAKVLDKDLKDLDLKEMGKRIRERRIALEMSREDLAELINVSPQFIADIEYGNKGLSIKRFYILTQVLNVTADYLLAGCIYEIETDKTAIRFKEEIIELIHKCDARQLKGIREIAEIYVDGVTAE